MFICGEHAVSVEVPCWLLYFSAIALRINGLVMNFRRWTMVHLKIQMKISFSSITNKNCTVKNWRVLWFSELVAILYKKYFRFSCDLDTERDLHNVSAQ